MGQYNRDVWQAKREQAVHLRRLGYSYSQIAEALGTSKAWVSKWLRRFATEGWKGLTDRSRRPHRSPRQLPVAVKKAVIQVRSELEAEAAKGEGLKFIGAPAIRTRLREKGVQPLPSIRSIERILHQAGLTRPKSRSQEEKESYPRLRPTQPHTLMQVDIYPRRLKGGQAVACFNAIDVVSRYPFSRAFERRGSQEAVTFLTELWHENGVPTYTQVDNESCFSGGHHPGVLGRVIRAALIAGTELVFSPIRHPQSQGTVESFHRIYGQHVWEGTLLANLEEVNAKTRDFLKAYRKRPHPQLGEQTPQQVHRQGKRRTLAPWAYRLLTTSSQRWPIYAGRVHFIRRIEANGAVRVLNLWWQVPDAAIGQKVWVTLTLTPTQAYLDIFDAAPDVPTRHRLVRHDFPVHEPVLPHPEKTGLMSIKDAFTTWLQHAGQSVAAQAFTMCWRLVHSLVPRQRSRSFGV